MKSSQVALAATVLGIFGAPTALPPAAEARDGHSLGGRDEAWRGQRIYRWGAAAIAEAYVRAARLFPNVIGSGRTYVWNMHRPCNGGP
jgi:hypothetical protein